VQQALEALQHLDHRGATSADPLTGDGVGVLTQVPHLFFRKKLEAKGVRLPRDSDMAVGMLFLPGRHSGVAPATVAAMVAEVERTAGEAGLAVLLWRRVPVGEYALGESAQASLPDIRQVVLRRPASLVGGGPDSDDAFERLLYLTRKRLERRLSAMAGGHIYIPSLSHRTIVYKGASRRAASNVGGGGHGASASMAFLRG